MFYRRSDHCWYKRNGDAHLHSGSVVAIYIGFTVLTWGKTWHTPEQWSCGGHLHRLHRLSDHFGYKQNVKHASEQWSCGNHLHKLHKLSDEHQLRENWDTYLDSGDMVAIHIGFTVLTMRQDVTHTWTLVMWWPSTWSFTDCLMYPDLRAKIELHTWTVVMWWPST